MIFKYVFGITIPEANFFAKVPSYDDFGMLLIVIENLIKEFVLKFY